MAFNRDRNSGRSGGGGFRSRPSFGGKPRFGDRGDRGPVEMHKAICDNCGKECEVPFRPTSGKPIYCSNCFESRGRSDAPRHEGGSFQRSNFEEKRMFDAVCDECGNSCQVPFQPSGEKPVYCSNCFGGKKGEPVTRSAGPQNNEQFAAVNAKLDQILNILMPIATEVEAEVAEEEVATPEEASSEQAPVEEKAKKPRKTPAKKK